MSFKYLTISNIISSELLELLSNNVIGTPNESMLYQHLTSKDKVINISNPYFVNLIKNKQLIGTCCFCSRETINSGLTFNSFYIRYFTFKKYFRRKSISSIRTKDSLSQIKSEINGLLEGEGLGNRASEKFFHYAYVDPNNKRSASLVQKYKFYSIRCFSTIIFNRFFPKNDKRSAKIAPNEVENMKVLLQEYYKNFNMFCFENFKSNSYYVIKDSKENIVAGVQANNDRWKVIELPGLKGKLILNVLSRLPLLNKVISKNYHFLSFEYIYCKEGYEAYLESLFESLLAEYNVNSAMMWIDNQTSLYRSLQLIKLGIVNKLNEEVNIDVIARFENFSEEEVKQFKENPAYISAIDQT